MEVGYVDCENENGGGWEWKDGWCEEEARSGGLECGLVEDGDADAEGRSCVRRTKCARHDEDEEKRDIVMMAVMDH
jgi:hypothetical protein